MQAVGTFLVLVWIAMVIIALIGLVRGHIDWARLRTRKSAGWLLAASIPVFVIAGLLLPKDTATKNAAAVTSTVTTPAPTTTAAPAPSTTTTTTTAPATTTLSPTTTTSVVPTTAPAAPATTSAGLSDQQIADLTYIGVLDMNHVHYTTKDAAIDVAHKVCNARAQGNSESAVGMAILNTGVYTAQDAGTIVGAAEAAYCPEYK